MSARDSECVIGPVFVVRPIMAFAVNYQHVCIYREEDGPASGMTLECEVIDGRKYADLHFSGYKCTKLIGVDNKAMYKRLCYLRDQAVDRLMAQHCSTYGGDEATADGPMPKRPRRNMGDEIPKT